MSQAPSSSSRRPRPTMSVPAVVGIPTQVLILPQGMTTEEAIAIYQDTFEATVHDRGDGNLAKVRLGASNYNLVPASVVPRPQWSITPQDQVRPMWLYFSDVDAAYRRLQLAGGTTDGELADRTFDLGYGTQVMQSTVRAANARCPLGFEWVIASNITNQPRRPSAPPAGSSGRLGNSGGQRGGRGM